MSEAIPIPSGTPAPTDALGLLWTPAPESAPAEEILDTPSETVLYVVQKGDTLWKIAKEFLGDGKKWRKIYEDNRSLIRDPNIIHIGQEFTIYLDAQKKEAERGNTDIETGTDAAVGTSAAPDMAQSGTTYTVQPDDCLWEIAVKLYGNGMLWEKIYQANQKLIKNCRLIYARQILSIPDR